MNFRKYLFVIIHLFLSISVFTGVVRENNSYFVIDVYDKNNMEIIDNVFINLYEIKSRINSDVVLLREKEKKRLNINKKNYIEFSQGEDYRMVISKPGYIMQIKDFNSSSNFFIDIYLEKRKSEFKFSQNKKYKIKQNWGILNHINKDFEIEITLDKSVRELDIEFESRIGESNIKCLERILFKNKLKMDIKLSRIYILPHLNHFDFFKEKYIIEKND